MKVRSLGGKMPTRKHYNDAGLDLYANGDYIIQKGKSQIIKTGVAIELPENSVGMITAKSRSTFIVATGIVDEGYTGELLVRIFAYEKDVLIRYGDPVAQLLVLSRIPYEYESLEDGERGTSGGIAESEN